MVPKSWIFAIIFQLFWLAFLIVYIYRSHYLDQLCTVDLLKLHSLNEPLSARAVVDPANDVSRWRDLDTFDIRKRLWWGNWTDDSLLALMPVLGTHNSASYTINNVFSLFAKTQRYSVTEQLNRGVRCLDIRLRLTDDPAGQLRCYHDFVDLNMEWARLWESIRAWLHAFPREGLVMLVRDEDYRDHHRVAKLATRVDPDRFVWNDNRFERGSRLRVGELRGKVFLLNHGPDRHMPWGDNRDFVVGRVNVGDRYAPDVSEEEKFAAVTNFYARIPKREVPGAANGQTTDRSANTQTTNRTENDQAIDRTANTQTNNMTENGQTTNENSQTTNRTENGQTTNRTENDQTTNRTENGQTTNRTENGQTTNRTENGQTTNRTENDQTSNTRTENDQTTNRTENDQTSNTTNRTENGQTTNTTNRPENSRPADQLPEPPILRLNLLMLSKATASPLVSVRNLAENLNERFVEWARSTDQQLKGCILVIDWV